MAIRPTRCVTISCLLFLIVQPQNLGLFISHCKHLTRVTGDLKKKQNSNISSASGQVFRICPDRLLRGVRSKVFPIEPCNQ